MTTTMTAYARTVVTEDYRLTEWPARITGGLDSATYRPVVIELLDGATWTTTPDGPQITAHGMICSLSDAIYLRLARVVEADPAPHQPRCSIA